MQRIDTHVHFVLEEPAVKTTRQNLKERCNNLFGVLLYCALVGVTGVTEAWGRMNLSVSEISCCRQGKFVGGWARQEEV